MLLLAGNKVDLHDSISSYADSLFLTVKSGGVDIGDLIDRYKKMREAGVQGK